MKNRILTGGLIAAIYVTFILLGIFVSRYFYDLLIVAIMLLAGLEMTKALGARFAKPLAVAVVLLCLIGYAAFLIIEITVGGHGLTAFFVVMLVTALICYLISLKGKIAKERVLSTSFVLLYPVLILTYLLALNYLVGDFRITAILLAFLISCFTDVFAFAVGITFKGPKLMPKVSPKKTISGAIGGLLGGVGAALLVMLFAHNGWVHAVPLSGRFAFNLTHFLVIGLFGAVFTQAGDLIASQVKRLCGIKDFGTILPGHGGAMDRVDGLMLNAVFIYAYISILLLFVS